MFAGHYGVSYALKKTDTRLSLGWLFLAVQFIDVLWALFIILGVEKMKIHPGLPSSPYDLYFMPYTHSLVGSLLWAGLVYAVFRYVPLPATGTKKLAALVMGAAVFSHFLLDFIVHRPDLPVVGNVEKIGLGLYNIPPLSFALETLVLFGGLWLYMRATTATTTLGKYGMPLFALILTLVNVQTYFGPPPPTPQIGAIFNEVCYLLFTAIAIWLDRKRVPVEPEIPVTQQPGIPMHA